MATTVQEGEVIFSGGEKLSLGVKLGKPTTEMGGKVFSPCV